MATSYLDLNGLKHLWEKAEESFSSIDTKAKDIYAEGIEETTKSGNPVEIDVPYEQNPSSLSVSFEPIQDLNGYDKVWSGGNGKNKLNPDLFFPNTAYGVTLTCDTTTGRCSFSGTNTESSNAMNVFITKPDLSNAILLNANTTYYFCANWEDGHTPSSSTPRIDLREYSGATTIFAYETSKNGGSYTPTEDVYVRICARFPKGFTSTGLGLKPVLTTDSDVSFEPYSNICPIYPGNGKNKLEIEATSGTINGITYTINDDGTVTVNGTATATTTIVLMNHLYEKLPAGNYILSGCPTDGNINIRMDITRDVGSAIQDIGAGATFEVGGSYNPNEARIVVLNGQTVNNWLFKPMIRLATETDPTFVPYQGTKIDRVGKNLLRNYRSVGSTVNYGITFTTNEDGTVIANGTATNTSHYLYINGRAESEKTKLPNGTYRFVFDCPSSFTKAAYLSLMKNSQYVHQDLAVCNATNRSAVFTINNDIDDYDSLHVGFYFGSGDISNNQHISLMIVSEAETDLTFEPYNSSSLILNLGRDVYGGTVDVVNGTLTVDREYISITPEMIDAINTTLFNGVVAGFTSSESFAGRTVSLCDSLNVTTYSVERFSNVDCIGIRGQDHRLVLTPGWCQSATTVGQFRTSLSDNPINIVVSLATPQTYSLTPQLLALLKGYNRISGDGIITIGYNATSDSTIQNELSEHEEELRNINQSISSLTSYDIIADGSGETTISGNEISISDAIGGNAISLIANVSVQQITEEAETVSCGSGTCVVTPLEDPYSSVDIIVKNGINQTKNTVALGTTIGGGNIDIINGTMVETYKHYFFTSLGGKGSVNTSDAYYVSTGTVNLNTQNTCLCNIGEFSSDLYSSLITSPVYGYISSYPTLFFIEFPKSFGLSTVDLANEFIAQIGGIELLIPLATPISSSFTPHNIALFSRNNIITGDRGTELLELTYESSTSSNVQIELNKQNVLLNNIINDIAPIEKSIAITNHSVGDYIILNGKFCKVTTAIATGEMITIGVNVSQTTISAEILAILSQ